MVVLLATMDLNFQQLPSTSAQPCSTQALSTKVSKKRQKQDAFLDHLIPHHYLIYGAPVLGPYLNMIIYHISAPTGSSINDFIDANTYTLTFTYCTVDDAYTIINKLGQGALLSKIDLKNAFRLMPVRQEDWNLLGIHWKSKYYIDTCLPFGLRSAPFLFNRLADAIHWILQNNYEVHHLLHYLDDFLTVGPTLAIIIYQQ